MTVNKPMSLYILLGSLFTGGGGYVGVEALLHLADQRWVTVASLHLQLKWNLEDRIAELQNRVDSGTDVPGDTERLAVLKDRLKRLNDQIE